MIDDDLLGRLLLRIEADAHRGGWDGPHGLFLLYDLTVEGAVEHYRFLAQLYGTTARVGRYVAQQMVPGEALGGRSIEAVYRLALNLAHVDPRPPSLEHLLRVWSGPGLIGVTYLFEAWGADYASEEERVAAAEAAGTMRLADTPGSHELRAVVAVDVQMRDHFVQRIRGKKVEAWTGGDATKMGGAGSESLRAIVAVLTGQPVPPITTVPTLWSWDEERIRQEGSTP